MIICNHNSGRLGNSIFRMFANIVFLLVHDTNGKIDYNVHCNSEINDDIFKQWSNNILNNTIPNIDINKTYYFNGFFQHDKIYCRFKNEIIDYIKSHRDLLLITDKNELYNAIDLIEYDCPNKYDIVIHIRLEDFIENNHVINPKSLDKIIVELTKDYPNTQICFVLNKPKSEIEIKYIEYFKSKYHIKIESNTPIEDFAIMRCSKILVCSYSTLSLCAALLSNSIIKTYIPNYSEINGVVQSFKNPIENTILYDVELCGKDQLLQIFSSLNSTNRGNNLLNPITFGFPEEKICDSNNKKQKILSHIIPGQLSTYIYDNEEDYYNEYKISYFATTMKKGGWDCLRHYEIVANRSIPYFIDIEECPPNTLALWPRDLLIESNQLYYEFKNKNINELSENDIYKYNEILTKLLNYFKENLTTTRIAEYTLEKTNFRNVTKILFLSKDTNPDYLRCLTLHGFKKLFGSNCHDYPKIEHIYKSPNIDFKKLYGKGITYTNLLEDINHNNDLDKSIEDDIKNKYYDIVIYGSYHRGMLYYDLISNIYKPNEIILLCGEDSHVCEYHDFLKKGHNILVREL